MVQAKCLIERVANQILLKIMVTGRKEVKNLVLVISCIEGYKQLTEYYKTKTKTAIHQCFVSMG